MSDALLRFAPFLAMACMIFMRPLVTGRHDKRRRAREAMILASMLETELESLVSHYDDNIALLSRDGTIALSIRAAGSVFRTNASRIAGLLAEPVVVPLVAVHAHHDRIEALIHACQGGNAGRNPRPNLDEAYLGALQSRFVAGSGLARSAIQALSEFRAPPELEIAGVEPLSGNVTFIVQRRRHIAIAAGTVIRYARRVVSPTALDGQDHSA